MPANAYPLHKTLNIIPSSIKFNKRKTVSNKIILNQAGDDSKKHHNHSFQNKVAHFYDTTNLAG